MRTSAAEDEPDVKDEKDEHAVKGVGRRGSSRCRRTPTSRQGSCPWPSALHEELHEEGNVSEDGSFDVHVSFTDEGTRRTDDEILGKRSATTISGTSLGAIGDQSLPTSGR